VLSSHYGSIPKITIKKGKKQGNGKIKKGIIDHPLLNFKIFLTNLQVKEVRSSMAVESTGVMERFKKR